MKATKAAMGDQYPENPGDAVIQKLFDLGRLGRKTKAGYYEYDEKGKRTGIQPGHGLFTTGATVDEAAWRFISMDRACQVQLLIEAAGKPELWPEEMARRLKQALGSPEFCWLSFQTLWDELVEEGSDFLE